MKVLHISYDAPGNPFVDGGGAKRAREFQKRLAYPGGKHQFDWLHCSTSEWIRGHVRSRLAFMWRAYGDLRSKRYPTDHDVIIYEFSPFSPIWIPKKLRAKAVLLYYHTHDFRSLWRKVGPLALICWWMQRRVLYRYPRVLTLSPTMCATLVERLGPAKVHAIPPGVDAELFELEPDYSMAKPYFLFLGRLDIEMKGIDILLEAWGMVNAQLDANLVIAGRGQMHPIIDLAERRGLDLSRINFINSPCEKSKQELLQHCRALVMPSRYEGWGIAAVEAQAAGKAVIGSRAIRDAVCDQRYLDDTKAILMRGMRELAQDEELARSIGMKSREWARKFSWDALAETYEQYLWNFVGMRIIWSTKKHEGVRNFFVRKGLVRND